jgi:hypothetical protein
MINQMDHRKINMQVDLEQNAELPINHNREIINKPGKMLAIGKASFVIEKEEIRRDC